MASVELPLGLPRTVVLKNKNSHTFLRYTNEEGGQQGLLQFTGKEAASPLAKFNVEASKTTEGLVHIRCASNNKYWRRWTSSNDWIAAAADSPEEDQSKWSCTLFKPVKVESDDQALLVRFLHVQLNHYASLFAGAHPYTFFLFAGTASPNKDLYDVCEVVDREALVVLPQHVVFKGDNGSYLRLSELETRNALLEFDAKDIGDPGVGHQVFTATDGAIRIRASKNDYFWGFFPNMIFVESEDASTNNPDNLFWTVKLDKNVIALRNQGNSLFCARNTYLEQSAYLEAGVPTITQEARLQVEEQVLSREIYDVKYRLLDARIYDQKIITAATEDTTNDSPNPVTNTLTLTHTDSKSTQWEDNVTVQLGVTASLTCGIPFIGEASIEVSAEESHSVTWGEQHETSDTLSNQYDATVSPYSKMKVSLVATQGTCDVPFSYTQRDVLFDGTPVTYQKDDGVYTGVNSYNYQYQTKEEPLPNRPPPPASSSA
ncbi:unnamed protein product [Linum tenue]|uniref:Agglutinin domain-containing protein n=1 Tax=Linum tenue TaxID=586396 RepID=A0AAV0J1Q2_9ROSI|nr:unnamed protein product [Linum tenue]